MAMKKTKGNMYNAKGAPEEKEIMDETAGFKKGGKAKHMHRKHGGKVEGEKEKHRSDRHKRASGGRTPYSSGNKVSSPSESGKTDSGHESQRPG